MRIISTALAATAVGALAAGLTATVATAQDSNITSFGFSVSPKTVKPGGKVDLTVTECAEEATASSGVFDKTTLGMGGGTQSAQVTVDWDAKPGAQYDVTFTCGDESGTAPLTIAASGGGRSEVGSTSRPPQPQQSQQSQQPGKESARATQPGKEAVQPAQPARPAQPAQPAKPTQPARGGLGGSQDGNTAMLAGGAGLTAAGAFGGVLLLRRRQAPGRG